MRQISNLEVRKIKRLNSKKDGQKIKTRTEIRVQADAQQKGREAEALRLPRLAAHRGRKQKGKATSGTRRGRGRMSRRHRRPLPGLAAAPGCSPRQSGRPPSRASAAPRPLCTSRFQESGGFTAEPRSPREPESPKPRAESHRVAARPRRGSGRPRKKEREMEGETTGEERKKPPPQIVPSRRERSSGVCRQIIP